MMAKNEGLGPLAAGLVAIGTVVGAVAIGSRTSPTPDHPRTRRWYKKLEQPGFNPPPPVYAAAWTGIQAGLAYGGYRLLRRPASSQRTLALTLWGINQAAIAGWSEIFFGQRAPGAGALAAGAMIGISAGYVTAAAREDDSLQRRASRWSPGWPSPRCWLRKCGVATTRHDPGKPDAVQNLLRRFA